MLEGAYTFGGHHFWEDVFFYQKWRIQRNYISKKCRLLDNWDIRRKEGSFEECWQVFLKFIEAFEIPKQKGHMIVMIPGFMESKNIFKELWRTSLKNGFLAAAINYPSTHKDIVGHVRQIDFFLNHLEGIDSISFVTHGISSVILKKLFTHNSPWQQKIKIGRIVEVNPRNHGSKLLQKLSNIKFLGFVLGPMAKEMNPKNIEKIPSLPKEIKIGIIFRESIWIKLLEFITRTRMFYNNLEKEKLFENATDIISFSAGLGNVFKKTKINNAIISFLKNGKF